MMATIPKRAEDRIKAGIKAFAKVIEGAKARDVNESDTVTIVVDMLSTICGYDKYTEITSEYVIRGTYCDLAIKTGDDKPTFLIEVKAINIPLKEAHLRQAIGYAASEGIEWVMLTNGDHWQAHRVIFGKPIKTEVAFDFSFSDTTKLPMLTDFFFLISKEGVSKSAIATFHEECQLTSKHMVAATLMTEPVVAAIRRQLMGIGKGVKITEEQILASLQNLVLKRDVLEGEEAGKAKRRLATANRQKKKLGSEVAAPVKQAAEAAM
ncbi:type I restriction enzyme HsdR N-terminal domain-containing protein [Thiovibrio frasassiensis]|uniref:Type I restriction enzyme HsdR N-terminal domain-containing protein n=1 Tax=Thiovibrio frasassiensis TaxID=2984131 RepID=A0A9X4MJB0_9BACT|nr:type I restriction enzyme HsdR N-terminal domain-containing protein [Thiovibrio frasassiensis]MDG4477070.1 type I restriction enzyme HsdR N-terminal domain-containing protein [Thiovibrio frasassiensis]